MRRQPVQSHGEDTQRDQRLELKLAISVRELADEEEKG
jgi:hypothetical protein